MRCPVVADFDPLSDGFARDNPFPLLQQLSDEHRVFFSPEMQMYFVTRHADIVEVLSASDGKRFSAGNASAPVCPITEAAQAVLAEGGYRRLPALTNADPPRHTMIAAGVRKCMSVRRLKLLEPMVRAKGEELVDAMVAKPVADLVADLAFPLPAFAGLGLLGFPEEDFEQIKAWAGNRAQLTYGRLTADEQVQAARDVVDFWHYCAQFVTHRAEDLRDDFTSDMIRLHQSDPDTPDLTDLVSIVYSMALAGHETTTNFIANGVLTLLRHPDSWQRLVDDPAAIPRAVEELLRYDPPVTTWRRQAVVDTTIGDVAIPAGAQVALLFAAANRDGSQFANPDELDLARPNATEHLTFGKGPHYCKGAPLARLEMKVCLEALTQHAPRLRLEGDVSADDYPPNLSLRGPRRLLVRTA